MKIAIIGYGKMGHLIEEVALSRGHEIVCIIDKDNQEAFSSAEFASADVAIEFTSPSTAFDNIKQAWSRGLKVVSGSTGWIADYRDEVEKACKEGNTLFWASNFSLGVALFSVINRTLAALMSQFGEYKPSITETHHTQKLDAPSGTAITLAEQLIANHKQIQKWDKADALPSQQSEGQQSAATTDTLPIYSLRIDDVPGIHTVKYESAADSIEITHSAKSRRGFALGAVMAAEYTLNHTGLIGIDDLTDWLLIQK